VNGRRPLLAANWKMNKTRAQARNFVEIVRQVVSPFPQAETCICPPFTALGAVNEGIRGSGIALGAQDLYWEKEGAYTGEISGPMLAECGCEYVLVGHSERRQLFGETIADTARKTRAAWDAGLVPILCVGESFEQRRSGETERVIETHVLEGTAKLSAGEVGKLVIAYEPIWAIGTGLPATSEEAQRISALIRGLAGGRFGDPVAAGLRILYGGSVKAANAAEFLGQADVDGALVGGASLDPTEFSKIVAAAKV